jgi:hypothetical protein
VGKGVAPVLTRGGFTVSAADDDECECDVVWLRSSLLVMSLEFKFVLRVGLGVVSVRGADLSVMLFNDISLPSPSPTPTLTLTLTLVMLDMAETQAEVGVAGKDEDVL